MNASEQTIKEEDIQSTKDVHPKPAKDPLVAPAGSKSIAIITCSTRPSRIGHLVAAHVASILQPILDSPPKHNTILSSVDLASHSLPLFDENVIPAKLPASDPTPHYSQPHARAWSAEITKHAAFVFVTPQYNWGYPATIKNALDYLYHEWGGKPAVVVSYGGRGGGLAATQLGQVCKALRMKVVDREVGFKIRLDESEQTREEGDFTEARKKIWEEDGTDGELERAGEELVGSLYEVDLSMQEGIGGIKLKD